MGASASLGSDTTQSILTSLQTMVVGTVTVRMKQFQGSCGGNGATASTASLSPLAQRDNCRKQVYDTWNPDCACNKDSSPTTSPSCFGDVREPLAGMELLPVQRWTSFPEEGRTLSRNKANNSRR